MTSAIVSKECVKLPPQSPPKATEELGIIVRHDGLGHSMQTCKVVIYNYVFCWLLFHAKFNCNYVQSFVPCISYGFYL